MRLTLFSHMLSSEVLLCGKRVVSWAMQGQVRSGVASAFAERLSMVQLDRACLAAAFTALVHVAAATAIALENSPTHDAALGAQSRGRSPTGSSRTAGAKDETNSCQVGRRSGPGSGRSGSITSGPSGNGCSSRTNLASSFLVRNLARPSTSPMFSGVRCGPSINKPVRCSSPFAMAWSSNGNRFTSSRS